MHPRIYSFCAKNMSKCGVDIDTLFIVVYFKTP